MTCEPPGSCLSPLPSVCGGAGWLFASLAAKACCSSPPSWGSSTHRQVALEPGRAFPQGSSSFPHLWPCSPWGSRSRPREAPWSLSRGGRPGPRRFWPCQLCHLPPVPGCISQPLPPPNATAPCQGLTQGPVVCYRRGECWGRGGLFGHCWGTEGGHWHRVQHEGNQTQTPVQ